MLLLAAAIAGGAALLSGYLENALFSMAAAAGIIACVLAAGLGARLILRPLGRNVSLLPFQRLASVIFGLMLAVVLCEIFFEQRERGGGSAMAAGRLAAADRYGIALDADARTEIMKRDGILTLPARWEHKPVSIAGSDWSYLWHGYLHVHDQNMFRRNTPFPPPRPGVMRLMLVGDSLTYGYGVEERFTYASLLRQRLGLNYEIEVLNLGKSGYQSEDILQLIRDFLPRLKPDLIFYGVVHNDFLPTHRGEYHTRGFEVPIPEPLQAFLTRRSRFARFVGNSYHASLRASDLRKDFFDDILEDFEGYQQRFARDLTTMNEFVTAQGLPPIVAMVLDQFPDLGARGHRITRSAERYMVEAGIKMIPTEEYYRRYTGHKFHVSLWEGHPDEEAHAIFASMILPVLETHPALQSFRKAASSSGRAAGS